MEDEDLIWGNVENPDPYDLLFDEDKARKAASAVKIFQDVSVGSTKEKMKEEGTQQRQERQSLPLLGVLRGGSLRCALLSGGPAVLPAQACRHQRDHRQPGPGPQACSHLLLRNARPGAFRP